MDVAQTEGGAALTASTELVSTLATVATVVSIALVIYSLASFIYDFIFQCTKDDVMTSYKTGMSLCHKVGVKCSERALGVCIKREKICCCFNTILARVLHEQARPQLGRGWGGPENHDCSGFSPGELASIDFSRVDLTEYMQYVRQKTEISPNKVQEIVDRAIEGFQK